MLARALYDNKADFADELTFQRGDTLVVIERELSGAPGWWLCSIGGRQGIVPANRLQTIAIRDQENFSESSSAVSSKRNRGYFYEPTTVGDQQQQQSCDPYLLASPASGASSSISPIAPPAYSETDLNDVDPVDDTTYENFASGETENLYEDPTLWNQPGDTTPTMLKKSNIKQQQTSGGSASAHLPPGGLLVTSTHQPCVELLGSATYHPSSTDSGVYSQPPSGRSHVDYAEDIYDYPAAFQQVQPGKDAGNANDGVYDLVPSQLGNAELGDYDFVHSPPMQINSNRQQTQETMPLGDYDMLPAQFEQISFQRVAEPPPIGQQMVSSDSMETLPDFTQAECEKAFESRRNVIERLVRYEHACTRAAGRWSRLFTTSGWRKSSYLVANAYAIQTAGEQLSHSMATFSAFAASALARLEFTTFSTLSNLRSAYQPLYIESQNFKKYLVSVGLVNWTLENAVPHLTKTFQVMLHSQQTFLKNLQVFSNIIKRSDFNTISATHTVFVNDQSSSTLNRQKKQQQHRTYMVVNDVQPQSPPPTTPVEIPVVQASPNRLAQRGVSTVHLNISSGGAATMEPATTSTPVSVSGSSTSINKASNTNTLTSSTAAPTSNTNTISRQNRTLRFAEDVELNAQLASDLEQRTGELSFVISTFVLSLRRTQPSSANKDVPELPGGQRYNGGFIECGKLLVNVAHSVVLIGDKLTSVVTEPERSEAIKTSTDRLRVCIRVFVEKLKSLAGAGSRAPSAVDDLITHVEVLRSQAETIRHRLGSGEPASSSHQSLSTQTAS